MTSSIYAAIFLGKDYSENLRSVRNTGQKPTNCTEIVRRDSKNDPRTKIGDIGSVRVELEKFYMKLSLVNDEEVPKLMKAKFTYSQILFCALERCESSYTLTSNGNIALVDQGHTAIQRRIGWNRWRTSGVRVEDIPRTNYVADLLRNPKNLCKPWLVNQNTSKDELSSRRC